MKNKLSTCLPCNNGLSTIGFPVFIAAVFMLIVYGLNTPSATAAVLPGSNVAGISAADAMGGPGCFGAAPLSCSSTLTDQILAIDATYPVTNCGFTGTFPGKWFSFTGTGSDMTVETCGNNTNFDTVIDVYSGSCTALVFENCNDDNCGLSSSLTFCTTEGVTYYVFVSGYSGATGNFDMSLYCLTTCTINGVADECINAVPVYADLPVYFDNFEATGSFPDAELCSESLFYSDIWYAFYNETPANITVSLCTDLFFGKGGTFHSIMSVYEACPTENFTALACVDGIDGLGECFYGGEVTFEGACNTTYYIRIGSVDIQENGDGEVTVTTQPITAAPLVADAGATANIILGNSTTLGGAPTATGGFPPYAYIWDNAGTLDNATAANPVATPVSTATTYSVTVTDACNETATASVLVNAISPCNAFMAYAIPSNPLCGNGQGSISVMAYGGTGNYTYNWGTQPGEGTNPRSGLPSGTYTVTVTDENSCTVTASATIFVPEALNLSISVTNASGCATTDNNASATASVSGGFTPYNFLWSGPAGFSSIAPSISNLQPGTYSVTVTDETGCTATQQATILLLQQLNCSATGTDVSCYGQNNGTATAITQGGNPPFSYAWSGSNGYTGNGQTITGLAPGNYSVTVTDASGCSCASATSGEGGSVSISEPSAFVVISGGEVNDEEGDSFVIPTFFNLHTIVLAGGSFPYDFDWFIQGYAVYNINYQLVDTDNNGIPDTPGAIINIIYTDNALWSLNVNDYRGCAGEAGAFITNNPLQVLDIDSYTILPAGPTAGGSLSLVVAGGVPCPGGVYNYQWTGPDNWTGSSTGPSAGGLPSGWYVITVTDCALPVPNVTVGWFWVPKLVRGRGKITPGALTVYPNPVNSQATITFTTPETGQVTLSLYAPDGRLIAQPYKGLTDANAQQTIHYSTAALPPGLYFAELATSTGIVHQQKLVIIH
ncbi:T9SS C-terminal target domain-containing protein [Sphingobacteriales bacterium UPWRP_1]|nr:hypothetical protein BVG80_14780 [Sphingobacteriales bacterium TSM_CSM]PSJ76576.1 T9SS C-terminal target domain-containing protein [Sphingobacteriales bacterium UPWRP_1]